MPHRALGAGVTGDRHACLGTIDAVAKHHRQGAAHHRLAQRPALHGFGCRQASHRQQRLIAFACGQHHLTAADGKHATGRSCLHLAVGDRLHLGTRQTPAVQVGQPSQQVARIDHGLAKAKHIAAHARKPRGSIGCPDNFRTRAQGHARAQHARGAHQARGAPHELLAGQHANLPQVGRALAAHHPAPHLGCSSGFLRVVAGHATQRILHARMQDALAAGGLAKAKRLAFHEQRRVSGAHERIQREQTRHAATHHQRVDRKGLAHCCAPMLANQAHAPAAAKTEPPGEERRAETPTMDLRASPRPMGSSAIRAARQHSSWPKRHKKKAATFAPSTRNRPRLRPWRPFLQRLRGCAHRRPPDPRAP